MANNILLMDNRQLIPRWHTSRKYADFTPNDGGKSNVPNLMLTDQWFNKSLVKWQTNPNIGNAVDLFSRFTISDTRENDTYKSLLRYLLDSYEELPLGIKKLVIPQLKKIDSVDGYSTSTHDVSKIISKLKAIVKEYPRDSLSWMDLSFYYSILGERDKALVSANIAQNIGGTSSFISRAFSRFSIHMGESDRAIYALNKSDLNNPLVLSANLAIKDAFNQKISYLKKARAISESWKGNPFYVSELKATLGTIELKHGNIRKGLKLIHDSLKHPTENVIAHARWLREKEKLTINNIPEGLSVEADVNQLYTSRKFAECRDKLIEMFNFQPYSSSALSDAGYISIVCLDDPGFVINMSNNRVPASHMSFGELNNLIVARLLTNDFDNLDVETRILSKRLNRDDKHALSIFMATSGLALMKNQMVKDGMKLYESSIDLLTKENLPRAKAIACHFYAQQLVNIDDQKYLHYSSLAKKIAKQYDVIEIYEKYK